MPALIDIKRRIRSVKSTQKVTRAMKMVSAAKLRRAQEAILAWAGQTKGGRPHKFAGKVVGDAKTRCGEAITPLAADRLTGSLAGFLMRHAMKR